MFLLLVLLLLCQEWHLVAGAVGGTSIGADGVVLQHSLEPPFTSSTMTYWRQSTSMQTDSDRVRLTPSAAHNGFVWNTVKSSLADFEFTFAIKLTEHLQNAQTTRMSTSGQGFAFWYTESPTRVGPVYGSHDMWKGLGVMFNTQHYETRPLDHTIITVVVNDGTQEFSSYFNTEGADNEDGQLGDSVLWRGDCKLPPFRHSNGAYGAGATTLIIRLSLREGTLSMDATSTQGTLPISGGRIAIDQHPLTRCFAKDKIELGTDKFIGFSAHSAFLGDQHDILALRTKDLLPHRTEQDMVIRREKYTQMIEAQTQKHYQVDEIDTAHFQHYVLQSLRQIQDTQVVMEEMQEQIAVAADTSDTESKQKMEELSLTVSKMSFDGVRGQLTALKGRVADVHAAVRSAITTSEAAVKAADLAAAAAVITSEQTSSTPPVQEESRGGSMMAAITSCLGIVLLLVTAALVLDMRRRLPPGMPLWDRYKIL